ncbi:MAG: chemotaxis protein CheW [Piscirickettsiaceae bacterium CG_4_9_14_3_um_filter_43_564]|nr:chemotaxis protein CheW [Thiomicrospira sp.]PIQ04946.1 MAG: chemotaxis protein CheW [Piscirickettsiaceae bacterium CG18_big_fil_WC_8_21_14_2_50_44_103]PIU38221.1 MAG: chemotaxis protein CheW [Piscirickettsiaceae bacterium CG07_land_8_20_14_0_80_44_28]PIW57328.1 MAG: chemotaxis protein CheW [Piscirickettsiaceae bacterium CG12_big_fil_rev_8_21_14_0_65_44_934]PIW76916.1 MAG: chemotaxis protein CheW [Piscirickettsiaceae bacterium CG_4_8_14_3_um_filter_44_38]PIX80871.1 MAG: chemotaxis protein Ch
MAVQSNLQSNNHQLEAFSLSDDEDEKYSGPSIRCVLFNLDSEIYGINVRKIREVLRVGHIRRVEGSAFNVLGVINVRGVIVTVVDTRMTYGLPSKPADDLSRIIIVELDTDNIVGMMVDSVEEVKDIPEKQFEAMSTTKEGASRYLQGIAHYKGDVIVLIDVDSMFSGKV